LAGTIPLPEVRWRAIHGLALIELSADRKGTALELMSRAVAIVDSLRAAIRVQEFQDGFLLDKQDLYDELVRLHLDLGNVAAALESSERSRGRNFIDLLGNTTLRLGRLEDQRAVEREAALRSEIEATERRLGGAAQEERSAIENDLARLRQDYADFLILIRATDPQLASLVAVEPVSVAELQALLDEGTHLLVYHLLDDELVAWVVSADSIDVRRVALSADELRRRLLAARESIQTFEPLGDDLAALSEFVLRPLLPLLDGAPRVCIVPHRELHLLPFAALPSTPGQVLIDEMAVFFVPSASVLRYTVSRRDDRANQRVLAFGDPDLGTAAFELPFARKEADRLRFDFDNVTVRLGAEATEGWLVANLQEYGIIHIASHGEYDPFAPLLSSLLLAPDGESDGLLTAEEIFGLTLRADLIALSACQTGLGRIGTGDDIIGLNRAFVYAGTRQLLSTLWRVDDISTALLFKHFYRQMRTTDRAEALRQAQLILKARPEYRHPARWAGLVLSGDWQ
jgi:CHAT domain-containing protein